MSIKEIRSNLPDYAKDTKINFGNVMTEEGSPELSQKLIYGIALATAYALDDQKLIAAIKADADGTLSADDFGLVKAATSIMTMNNVYYRTLHLLGDNDMLRKPANLRMNILQGHGGDHTEFEYYTLAVSAVNACSGCVKAHVNALKKADQTDGQIQSCFRIVGVLAAVSQTLKLEASV